MKLTGGGRFDPSEGPVYFAAGTAFAQAKLHHNYSLMATNDVAAEGGESEMVERLADPEHRLLFDSGIFWMTNRHKRAHGISMDEALALSPDDIDGFDELWDTYTRVVSKYEDQLWGYIELDQGGAENKRKTRARLEATGLRPIPVYHPMNDGWDYFDELCGEYDRICVGNVVQADSLTRRTLLHTIWERHRRYPHVWIHLLGLTPNRYCTVYPANSCDSISVFGAVIWGAPQQPLSTAMNDPLGRLHGDFSYQPTRDTMADGGWAHAARLGVAQAMFLTTCWRRQQADLERLLGHPPFPPVDDREGVRV